MNIEASLNGVLFFNTQNIDQKHCPPLTLWLYLSALKPIRYAKPTTY
jgi:hypothetical protein